ncbi:MAG: hypothetical protein OEZ22_07585 [Spirochaetia bacterium]|nr:hypothetical protein [Spirochaetia bacterium]
MAVTIDKVIHDLDELSFEDKEYVKEIFDKMFIEARRAQILDRGKEAIKDYETGKSKRGSVKDLMKVLND